MRGFDFDTTDEHFYIQHIRAGGCQPENNAFLPDAENRST